MRSSYFVATVLVSGLVSSAAWAQVDVDRAPTDGEYAVSAGFVPDPQEYAVTGGGSADASAVSDGCLGWIGSAPDVRINYTAGPLPMRLYVDSPEDTTLVVSAPDGSWHCDDDTVGPNPVIDFASPASGQYDVFIGSHVPGQYPSVTLYLTELPDTHGPSASEADENQPGRRRRAGRDRGDAATVQRARAGRAAEESAVATDPSGTLVATTEEVGLGGALTANDPHYGRFEVSTGFTPDPATVSLQAGGALLAESSLTGCTARWINTVPDVAVTYTAGTAPIRFYVQTTSADRNTTLAIHAPNDTWYCVDDSVGVHPVIDFANPESGTYYVFVGTTEVGRFHNADLSWTELPDTYGPTE